jgi:hypothetical protein
MKIHYRVYTSSFPLVAPALGQLNPVHPSPPLSLKLILIIYFYLRLGLPSGLFPSVFTRKPLNEFLPFSRHFLLLILRADNKRE